MIYLGSYGTRIASWPEGLSYSCPAPSFLAIHPSLPVLYAACEQEGGVLAAFRLGREQAARMVHTGGKSPCHVAIHPEGELAAVANYADGSVAVIALDSEGLPSEEPLVYRFTGSGPNKERQEGPHAHFVKFIGDELYVVDLGSDRIHRLDHAGNLLGAITFPAGTGPRHFAGGRPGQWFVACELEATVRSFREEDGEWTAAGHVKASEHEGVNYPSHIECSSDGSLVYVANRGPNTITVFSADDGAQLTRVGEVPCQGAWPRHFALLEGSLIVANQDGGNVVRFALDGAGLPSDPEQLLNLDSASCVLPCDDARAVW